MKHRGTRKASSFQSHPSSFHPVCHLLLTPPSICGNARPADAVLDQLLDRTVENQTAFVDKQHAAGHRLHFLQNVGGKQNGFALGRVCGSFPALRGSGWGPNRRWARRESTRPARATAPGPCPPAGDSRGTACRWACRSRCPGHKVRRRRQSARAAGRRESPRASARNFSRLRGVMSGYSGPFSGR